MSYSHYPEYKESGVQWLGKVPNHWRVEPFKRQIDRNDGGVWGEDPDGVNDTFVLRSTEQTANGQWKIDEPATRKLSDVEINGSLLKDGDLLLTKSSGSSLHIGKTTLVTSEIAAMNCCYSNFMQRIRTKPTFLPALAWHVLNSDLARLQFDLLSNSTTGLANLNSAMIGQMLLPVPPVEEQIKISAFLDRETEKIDELAKAFNSLIDLLIEKRQAVISHAVTKGLDPSVPMKDSGIEWLGEVPAHWSNPTLNTRYLIELGKMLDESRITGEFLVPYLRNVDVQWNSINFDDLPCMDIQESEYGRYTVQRGDLMVCEGGEVGRAAMVGQFNGVIGFQKALHRIRSRDESECPDYLYYTFVWAAGTGVFDLAGNSTIAHLTGEQLRRYRFPRPPIAEQIAKAAYLDSQIQKTDLLIQEAQMAINLLQERRTALISAAVTGKIDVRDLVNVVEEEKILETA